MRVDEIEARIQEIRNEINHLDYVKESNDDVNVHEIEQRIDSLITERNNLVDLLDRCFDDLIGL